MDSEWKDCDVFERMIKDDPRTVADLLNELMKITGVKLQMNEKVHYPSDTWAPPYTLTTFRVVPANAINYVKLRKSNS